MSKADASGESSSGGLKGEEDQKNPSRKSQKIAGGDGDEDEEEECKTPILSEEQKIPAVQSCPPAPAPKRQWKKGVVGRKRKGTQLQFFEDGGKEEVESFFQSTTCGNNNISSTTTSSSVVPQSTTSSTTTSKKRRRKSRK